MTEILFTVIVILAALALVVCVLSWLPTKVRNRVTAGLFVVTFAGTLGLYAAAYAEMNESLVAACLYALHSTVEAFFGGEGYLLFELSEHAPHWVHEPPAAIAFWVLHIMALLFDVMVAATIFGKKMLGHARILMALGTTNIVIGGTEPAVIAAGNISTHDGARPRGDWRELAVLLHPKDSKVACDSVWEKGGVVLDYGSGGLDGALAGILRRHVIAQRYNIVFFQATNDDWVAFLELVRFLETEDMLKRAKSVHITLVSEKEVDLSSVFDHSVVDKLYVTALAPHEIVARQLIGKLEPALAQGAPAVALVGFGNLGQYVYGALEREMRARGLALEVHAFDARMGNVEGALIDAISVGGEGVTGKVDATSDTFGTCKLVRKKLDAFSPEFLAEIQALACRNQAPLGAVVVCLGNDELTARVAQNVAACLDVRAPGVIICAEQTQGHNLTFAKNLLGYEPFGGIRLTYTEQNLQRRPR